MKKLIGGILAFFSTTARDTYRRNFMIYDAKRKCLTAAENVNQMKKSVIDAKASIKVSEGKKAKLEKEIVEVKNELKALVAPTKIGKAPKIDSARFNLLKTKLTAKQGQLDLVLKAIESYTSLVKKFESAITRGEAAKEALKYKVESLSQKQAIVKHIGSLNDAIQNVDPELGDTSFEEDELDDAAAKELAKFEVMDEEASSPADMDAEQMTAFIKSL